MFMFSFAVLFLCLASEAQPLTVQLYATGNNCQTALATIPDVQFGQCMNVSAQREAPYSFRLAYPFMTHGSGPVVAFAAEVWDGSGACAGPRTQVTHLGDFCSFITVGTPGVLVRVTGPVTTALQARPLEVVDTDFEGGCSPTKQTITTASRCQDLPCTSPLAGQFSSQCGAQSFPVSPLPNSIDWNFYDGDNSCTELENTQTIRSSNGQCTINAIISNPDPSTQSAWRFTCSGGNVTVETFSDLNCTTPNTWSWLIAGTYPENSCVGDASPGITRSYSWTCPGTTGTFQPPRTTTTTATTTITTTTATTTTTPTTTATTVTTTPSASSLLSHGAAFLLLPILIAIVL